MIMKCYEIFSRLSPPLTNEIFAHLIENEKPVYKAMIQNIATRRKLRPIFIERKPRDERHVWLKQALSAKERRRHCHSTLADLVTWRTSADDL